MFGHMASAAICETWLRARQRSIAVSGLPVLLGRSEQPPALAVEGLDGLLNHLNVTSFEQGLPQGVPRDSPRSRLRSTAWNTPS